MSKTSETSITRCRSFLAVSSVSCDLTAIAITNFEHISVLHKIYFFPLGFTISLCLEAIGPIPSQHIADHGPDTCMGSKGGSSGCLTPFLRWQTSQFFIYSITIPNTLEKIFSDYITGCAIDTLMSSTIY